MTRSCYEASSLSMDHRSRYSLAHTAIITSLLCTQHLVSSQAGISKAPSAASSCSQTAKEAIVASFPSLQKKQQEGLCLIPVAEPPIPLTLTFPPSLLPLARNYHYHQTHHMKHLPGVSLLLDGACDIRTPIFRDSFLKGVDKHWEGTPRKGPRERQ